MDEDCIRACNNEEVPYMECEDMCCCDCTVSCVYRCRDMDSNGECTRFQ